MWNMNQRNNDEKQNNNELWNDCLAVVEQQKGVRYTYTYITFRRFSKATHVYQTQTEKNSVSTFCKKTKPKKCL